MVISTDKPLDTPLQKAAFAVYRTLAAPFYKRRAQKQEAAAVPRPSLWTMNLTM